MKDVKLMKKEEKISWEEMQVIQQRATSNDNCNSKKFVRKQL